MTDDAKLPMKISDREKIMTMVHMIRKKSSDDPDILELTKLVE